MLLPDIALGLDGWKKQRILLMTGGIITLALLLLSWISLLPGSELPLLLLTVFIGSSFLYFGKEYFGPGLYLSVFSVLIIMRGDTSHVLEQAGYVVLGTAITYIIYCWLPLDLSSFALRANIKKSIQDAARLYASYAKHDDLVFYQLRASTWRTMNAIHLLLEKTNKIEEQQSIEEYLERLWELRRLIVLLYYLNITDPKEKNAAIHYCLLLASRLNLLTTKKEKEIFKHHPPIPEHLPKTTDQTLHAMHEAYSRLAHSLKKTGLAT
ncbi:hypothetical protein JYU14_02620 [Simkania negevensis]|uniref:FUSC family protein n=1 Tax=Simkania negevensis TaxID=83561 RepID=A0ABS3AS59_9BACT|nr:hypothetical protein [Simkania negevensis]